MHKISRTVLLIAGAMSVAGCQSILAPLGLANRADRQQPAFGATDLVEGREALAANLPGKAIPAFQRATLNPETEAAAYNGLGVAYARLQRGDLAERYFRLANALDRENETYATNLVMFYASDLAVSTRALAARESETEQALAAAIVEPVEEVRDVRTVANATITIERPVTRLSQTAGRELLVSAEARAEPRARDAQVAVADLPSVSGAPQTDAAAPPYPIRIDIGGKVPKAAPRATYPIRIALPTVADAN